MIHLTDSIWIGDSADVEHSDLTKVDALLNVAVDLKYPIFDHMHLEQEEAVRAREYAQVGLVDGPGNLDSAYCAAVLMLGALLDRHDVVLVYDHEGSRSLVVAMMYLALRDGKVKVRVDYLRRRTWEEQLAKYNWGRELPKVHPAHIGAFNGLPYGLLEVL